VDKIARHRRYAELFTCSSCGQRFSAVTWIMRPLNSGGMSYTYTSGRRRSRSTGASAAAGACTCCAMCGLLSARPAPQRHICHTLPMVACPDCPGLEHCTVSRPQPWRCRLQFGWSTRLEAHCDKHHILLPRMSYIVLTWARGGIGPPLCAVVAVPALVAGAKAAAALASPAALIGARHLVWHVAAPAAQAVHHAVVPANRITTAILLHKKNTMRNHPRVTSGSAAPAAQAIHHAVVVPAKTHCGTIQTYALRAQLKIEVGIGHTACGKLISTLWLAGILRGVSFFGADQCINVAAPQAVRAQGSSVNSNQSEEELPGTHDSFGAAASHQPSGPQMPSLGMPSPAHVVFSPFSSCVTCRDEAHELAAT